MIASCARSANRNPPCPVGPEGTKDPIGITRRRQQGKKDPLFSKRTDRLILFPIHKPNGLIQPLTRLSKLRSGTTARTIIFVVILKLNFGEAIWGQR